MNLNQSKTISTNAFPNSIWERERVIFHFGDKDLDLVSLKNNEEIQIKGKKIQTSHIILAEQIHGNSVQILGKEDAGAGISKIPIPQVDALITNEKNIFLAIKTADCVPILIYDPIREVIAATHSGREGTRKNIVKETLIILLNDFKSNPKNLIVKLGPSICEKCYEIDRITFDRFVKTTGIEQEFPFLNIKKVLLHQLKTERVSQQNIENIDICTFEDEHYFSFRRNGTKRRQISLFGMIA